MQARTQNDLRWRKAPLTSRPMTFTEKLAPLSADKNKSSLAKAAGLPATAISNYISRKYIPRADTALRIAEALHVPLQWLVDDREPWPPPEVEATPQAAAPLLSDSQLMGEVLRRRKLAQGELAEKLDRAEKIDWAAIRKSLESLPANSPVPASLLRDAMLAFTLLTAHARSIAQFDVPLYEYAHRKMLPDDRKVGHLDPAKLVERYERLLKQKNLPAVLSALQSRQSVRESPDGIEMGAWASIVKLIFDDAYKPR